MRVDLFPSDKALFMKDVKDFNEIANGAVIKLTGPQAQI